MKPSKINTLGISLAMIAAVLYGCQTKNEPTDDTLENIEYELVEDWPQLPPRYQVGQPTGIGIDSEGHIFVFHRASRRWTEPFPDSLILENTILELENETGKLVNSWGANSFIMPHR